MKGLRVREQKILKRYHRHKDIKKLIYDTGFIQMCVNILVDNKNTIPLLPSQLPPILI